MTKYKHTDTDRWVWRLATYDDFAKISNSAYNNAKQYVEDIFDVQQRTGEYNLLNDLTKQTFQPHTAFILLAEDKNTKELLCYTWGDVSQTIWSTDRVLNLKIIHVDSGTAKERIRMVAQMMLAWEEYCLQHGVPVICSSSVRSEQRAYMRLHEQAGYSIRGSFAYKRVMPF